MARPPVTAAKCLEGSIGSGSTPVAVSAALSGLKVGTTYHFRVSRKTKSAKTRPDQTFTTVASAPVDATYTTGVDAGEATLHTLINPLGHDTHLPLPVRHRELPGEP